MNSGQEFFNESEAQEILRIAAQNGSTSGMTREELVKAASELGITPESIEQAAQQLKAQKAEEQAKEREKLLREEYSRERRTELMKAGGGLAMALATFVVVMALMGHVGGFPFWLIFVFGFPTLKRSGRLFSHLSYEDGYRDWRSRRFGGTADAGLTSPGPAAVQPPTPVNPYVATPAMAPIPRPMGPTPGSASELDVYISQLLYDGVTSRYEAVRRYQDATGADPQTASEIIRMYSARHPGVLTS